MADSKNSVRLSSGYNMPLLGLGTYQDETQTIESVKVAIESGYRLIDTAFIYKNETFIGKVLKEIFEKGTVKRSDLFIVTKLPGNGLGEDSVEYFLRKSLSALQVDYVDLYLIHTPMASIRTDDDHEEMLHRDGDVVFDHDVSLVKTWRVMETMVDKGLTRSIGLSNFNSKQIQRIVDKARIMPANLQVECHVYLPQYELHEFCNKLNISMTAYSPLGCPGHGDVFKEKYNMDEIPILLQDPVVEALAEKHDKSVAQILLRYLVQRGIAVIPRSSNPKRIKENIQIFEFVLPDEDMEILKFLGCGHRFFDLKFWKGVTDHPEYPFHEPF